MPARNELSRRFTLPADAPYLRNLAALWAVNPKLAAEIEAADSEIPSADADLPRDNGLKIDIAKTGAPTLTVRDGDGRILSFHSRYDPAAEGRKLIEGAKIDSCVVFYVLGFGLGYHVEALFEKASTEAMIFIFETDLRILRAAMQSRDLTPLIDSGRVQFMPPGLADKSELFLRMTPHAAMCSMGLEGLIHPPSLALHPAYYGQVQALLTEFAAFARTCLNTLLINGRRTAENITRNLAWYTSTPSVSDLGNKYKNKPAIIVSAGPSLRKNQHLLKDAQGKAVIIAVQTILQPLVEMGIEPQFVTSLDYHDISTRYYEKLPAHLKTHLVAEPKASNAIFAMFPGPLTILGNDYADRLLRENAPRPAKGRLPSGSTVAHLAYYLAEHLGCDPIIFIGQDLGFGDGLAYSPGTNIDDVWRPELGRFCTMEMRQWEFIARDRHILRKIPDVEGRAMYTEERLFTYLQQFERDFLRTKTRIIDATEGGALKRGTRVMKLAEAIQEFCGQDLPTSSGCVRSTVMNEPGQSAGSDSDQSAVPDGAVASAIPDEKGGGTGKSSYQSSPSSVAPTLISNPATSPASPSHIAQCIGSLKSRHEEAREIEAISRETLPLVEEIRDHVDDQPRVNRAIARIDLLRARMDVLGATYDLITQFTQQTELQRFQRDRQMMAARASGADLQKLQIGRDVENVRAVCEAAGEFQGLMDEVITKLSAMDHSKTNDPASPAPATTIHPLPQSRPEAA